MKFIPRQRQPEGEPPQQFPLLQRAELKLTLETSLQLPVDILFQQTGKPATAFQSLAKAHAHPLELPGPTQHRQLS